MADQNFVSLACEDFVRGGLLNDCDVIIKSARWIPWDYEGNRSTKDILAAELTLQDVNTDEDVIQHWANGKIADFCPNPENDGDTLIRQAGRDKLTQGNFFLFLQSLEDAGMPPIRDGKLSNLVGIQCHVERKAPPKRPGLEKENEGKEKKGDGLVLMCTGGLKMPGDKSKGNAKKGAAAPASSAKAGAGKPAAAAKGGDAPTLTEEQTDRAKDVLMGIVSEGAVKVSDLKMAAFKLMKEDAVDDRTAITKAITSADWLGENGFTVEGSGPSMKVSMG